MVPINEKNKTIGIESLQCSLLVDFICVHGATGSQMYFAVFDMDVEILK